MLIAKVAISFAKYKKIRLLCFAILSLHKFQKNGQNRVIRKNVLKVFED